ncbi:MAG: arginase [Crocinitomicaceae bacterium]|nr:arginase [Crocinitomicaceae bacterium]|tara:strand:- start:2789 stop:3940 length:1152 start_codon:yes stop_codon:yes gene_type:complete
MNLDIYFQPIDSIEVKKNTIGSICEIYNTNFPDWESSDIVLISVDENLGFSELTSLESNHVKIRQQLYDYHLAKGNKLKMADLGIIKRGASTSDTYAALEDITAEIQKKGKLLLILGGTQDLTYANYLGYKKLEQTINVTCIDQKIDLEMGSEAPISSNNFINHLLTFQPSFLFNFSILGCQQYYISEEQLNLFDELYFDYLRLGELNNNIKLAEPYLRNSDIISLDISSIRRAEFSGANENGPNGFFANEICQIAKYAGISDKLSSFGAYNFSKILDDHEVELAAQIFYFIIDGFCHRKKDYPIGTKKNHVKYAVFHEELKHNLVFHKSPKSQRWWLEVPYPPLKDFKFERHNLVPCNYEDYLTAQKGLIPDLWWKTYRKLN